jgi:hypothetical protein
VYEYRTDAKEEVARPFRYPDTWPPVALWDDCPNWGRCLGEEGRRGQDETTIGPCRNQRYIDENVTLTAGEAFLADGRCLPALIGVERAQPRRVICFEESRIWAVDCNWYGQVEPNLTPEQKAMFPMRVLSRLSKNPRTARDRIAVVITEDGKTDWLKELPRR